MTARIIDRGESQALKDRILKCLNGGHVSLDSPVRGISHRVQSATLSCVVSLYFLVLTRR
jgi:hypothetical protein